MLSEEIYGDGHNAYTEKMKLVAANDRKLQAHFVQQTEKREPFLNHFLCYAATIIFAVIIGFAIPLSFLTYLFYAAFKSVAGLFRKKKKTAKVAFEEASIYIIHQN